MNVKEVIFHTIPLVLMSCTGAIVELAVIGAPPEIVFLREDDLYKTASSFFWFRLATGYLPDYEGTQNGCIL